MLIKRDGTWVHEGMPIRRLTMVQLFASVLRMDSDGEYYLVTPVEKVRIRVEDCPFTAIAMEVVGEGESQSLHFETNTGEVVTAGAEHLLQFSEVAEAEEPHPVVHIRSGLNALISRAVFYRLVDLAISSSAANDDEDGEKIGLWSDGMFFPLGTV